MLRGSRVRNGVEGEGGGGISVADPLLNGYKLASFAYGPGEHWCQPVVTVQHVLLVEASAVWQFERRSGGGRCWLRANVRASSLSS
jgi:hypothetical protein